MKRDCADMFAWGGAGSAEARKAVVRVVEMKDRRLEMAQDQNDTED